MKTAKQINAPQCGESELRRIQERGERLRDLAASDAATRGESSWYVGKTGNHQGIVIDQSTGRNVAVTYQAADAPLVAAAPELLDTLQAIVNCPDYCYVSNGQAKATPEFSALLDEAVAMIAKAKGGQ